MTDQKLGDANNPYTRSAMIVGSILGMVLGVVVGWPAPTVICGNNIVDALIGAGLGGYFGAIVAKRIIIVSNGAVGRIIAGAVIGAGLPTIALMWGDRTETGKVFWVYAGEFYGPAARMALVALSGAFYGAAVAAVIRTAIVRGRRWASRLAIVGTPLGAAFGVWLSNSFGARIFAAVIFGAVAGLCIGAIGGFLLGATLALDDLVSPDRNQVGAQDFPSEN